ncbi:MAG: hypothetical protein J2P19_22345 [Pseudonocardia sp.]|nr:hypothetical protein [Pseudonocardia sp.]
MHTALVAFEASEGHLPGLRSPESRDTLVAQVVESQRRRRYVVDYLRNAHLRVTALDPASGSFDPLKAAVLLRREGRHDEACWLVFLSVHFGRHLRRDWELSAHFYGRLGQGGRWDWPSISGDVEGVRDWLDRNQGTLRELGPGFGNHRKYESLRGYGPTGTGAVITTYADWVGTSHSMLRPDSSRRCQPGLKGSPRSTPRSRRWPGLVGRRGSIT